VPKSLAGVDKIKPDMPAALAFPERLDDRAPGELK
jgi:hypothetical protein